MKVIYKKGKEELLRYRLQDALRKMNATWEELCKPETAKDSIYYNRIYRRYIYFQDLYQNLEYELSHLNN